MLCTSLVRLMTQLLTNAVGYTKHALPLLPAMCGCAESNARRVQQGMKSWRTHALQVGAEFLNLHYPLKLIYMPSPTWANHNKIFPLAGIQIRNYRYYKPSTRGLDYEVRSKSWHSSSSRLGASMPGSPLQTAASTKNQCSYPGVVPVPPVHLDKTHVDVQVDSASHQGGCIGILCLLVYVNHSVVCTCQHHCTYVSDENLST